MLRIAKEAGFEVLEMKVQDIRPEDLSGYPNQEGSQ